MICLVIQINYVDQLKEKENLAWNIRYITFFLFFFFRFGDTNNASFFQHHMPVLPNVQRELEDEYRRTVAAVKK